jgi:hypothetical protein
VGRFLRGRVVYHHQRDLPTSVVLYRVIRMGVVTRCRDSNIILNEHTTSPSNTRILASPSTTNVRNATGWTGSNASVN